MKCLLTFLLGFCTCAGGVLVAIMLDISLDKVESWLKGLWKNKEDN